MAQYQEWLQSSENARARKDAALKQVDKREAEILRYFQNTTYRKRDEETQNEPHPTDRR